MAIKAKHAILGLGLLIVVALVAASARAGFRWWTLRQQSALELECQALMEAEQWTELEARARAWLELDARNGFAWLYLGEAAQRQGDFELTADCLAALDDDDPKCIPALLELVELQLGKLNRPLDAVATCDRILDIDPTQCTAHQRLVFFYAMTLQRREMIRRIRRSIDYGCNSREMYVYLVGASSLQFTNGYQVTSHWREAHPDHEPILVAQAVFLSQLKSDIRVSPLSESYAPGDETLVHQCREHFPANLEVLAFFLDKCIENGEIDELAELLGQAPPEAEQDSRFWRFQGWYYASQGLLEEAESAYRQALRWDPYNWRSRHELASILRRQNKLEEVDQMTELAFEGKQLERSLLELATAVQLPPELQARIGEYAERVEDAQVVRSLKSALNL